MSSLGGQRYSPPSLVALVVFALGEFLSVAAVLYLLFQEYEEPVYSYSTLSR